jgi:hypothetical protein
MNRARLSWRERADLKRWLRQLDDRELSRVVHSLSTVDRAAQRYRARQAARS